MLVLRVLRMVEKARGSARGRILRNTQFVAYTEPFSVRQSAKEDTCQVDLDHLAPRILYNMLWSLDGLESARSGHSDVLKMRT